MAKRGQEQEIEKRRVVMKGHELKRGVEGVLSEQLMKGADERSERGLRKRCTSCSCLLNMSKCLLQPPCLISFLKTGG